MRLRMPRDMSVPLLLAMMLMMTAVSDASPSARSPRQRPARRRPNSAIIFPDMRRTTPEPLASCVDYAGRRGLCVTIDRCGGLRRLLATDGPTPQTIRRLRAGDCGVKQGVPLVCCGYGDPPTSPPPPPSPEQHPNLAILERGEPCGVGGAPRIIGGNVTGIGEFPWVAALFYTVPGSDVPEVNCGGTFIGHQYVLTAAHCVTKLPEGFQLHSVRLGEHDLSTEVDCDPRDPTSLCLPPPQQFNVSETIVHPRYDDPELDRNDIALLRLDRPAIENDGVRKLCLPLGAKRFADPTGTNAIAAGFGVMEGGFSSDVMLKVRLPVVPQERCSGIIARRGRSVGPGQLCAGGEIGKDSCVGDSGGPLFVGSRFNENYHIIGVTSFGPLTCGIGGVPGVYTRVTEYLNWILDNVRE